MTEEALTAEATEAHGTGEPMIVIEDLSKWFGDFQALKDVDLVIGKQEVVVVCGPSGSGKSTLIRCINRLEQHDKGRIVVDGIELTNDLRNIQEIRREVGMVFQQFNLFPHMSVLENVTLAPRHVRRAAKAKANEAAMKQLERVRIPEQANKFPGQLSGGQQQRVAIARALVSRPTVLFADEPTGNLDSATGQEILQLLRASVDALGQTTVMVTHDARAAAIADRILFLADGLIVREIREATAHEVLVEMEQLSA